jgi:hypothetical protein
VGSHAFTATLPCVQVQVQVLQQFFDALYAGQSFRRPGEGGLGFRGLRALFSIFPTPSVPGWQDAWSMGRCWREEAH